MNRMIVFLLVLVVAAFGLLNVVQTGQAAPLTSAPAQQTDCVRGTFPSYHNEGQEGVPPADYDGPVFELRQDYPDTLPPQEDYPWLDIPFENGGPTDPETYLSDLLAFGFEGNWEVDWYVQQNTVRDWYHVPWQHYGANGREFVHGLTHELDLKAGFLGPDQTDWTNTWAVAVFNERAGWAIGQMWCDPENPQPDMLNPNQDEPNWFPEGSMVIKLLFNNITDEMAPYMRGSFTWQADTYVETVPDQRTPQDDPERSIHPVRLLQIDVAVRDSRSVTGWLFGSYTYDGRNYVDGDDPLNYLQPIGIQWGNDPGITPEMIEAGAVLQEAWINDALRDLPSNHLGWGGRVAGPADNAGSACMSCHMTAGVPAPPILAIMVTPAPVPNERYLNWFINTPAGVTFGYNTQVSLDYSLQLVQGLQNFHTANENVEEMAQEQHSPRGPDRTPPAALVEDSAAVEAAPTEAPPPTAAAQSDSSPVETDGGSGPNLALVIVALVIGLAAGLVGGIAIRRR